MEANDELAVGGDTAPEARVAAVKGVFERIAEAGLLEGIEELLRICHDDVELSAYAQTTAEHWDDEPRLLNGKDAVRNFFRNTLEQGFVLQVRPRRFTTEGDTVVVGGSIRVTRPDRSFAETLLHWNFHFRDGLVDEVGWEPAAGG
jgi:ketosteroid isomerase-like protein